MKKLSVILWTSLITLGLFITSNVNAMTYTVNWETTSIAIPKWINWTTIKRCDDCETTLIVNEENGCDDNKCCERPINSNSYIVCKHKYDAPGTYTVNFDGKNNEFSNIYLDAANIQSITDYSNIWWISNLFLWWNPNFILPSNFSNTPVTNLYLDHNEISSYNTSIPDNIGILSLESNLLTKIPQIVRDARTKYRIKLSPSTLYNPYNKGKDKTIDLSDNQINFIEILSHPSTVNDTSYQTQRFGYTYDETLVNDEKITYNYKIFPEGGNENTPSITWLVEWNNGSNIIANISLNPPIQTWYYTFKVCIDTTNICAIKENFLVNYSVNIIFTEQPNAQIHSIDNIRFSRSRNWNYPETLISWYAYKLDDDSITHTNTTSYTIPTARLQDNPSWSHTFTVYLIDINWNEIKSKTTSFTIAINNDITINKPISPIIWEWSDQIQVDLDWNNASTLFNHYIYYLSTANSCTDVNTENTIIPATNTNIRNFTWSENLSRWTYLLCIDMYDIHDNKLRDTIAHPFSVEILPTLSITAPVGEISSQPIEFKRDSFIASWYNFESYTYTIKKWSNIIFSGKNENFNSKSFTYSWKNLPDWTYTFNITLNYHDTSIPTEMKSVSATPKTFIVNLSNEARIDILTPNDWATFTWKYTTKAPVNLARYWSGSLLISKYFYTLTDTNTSKVLYSWYESKNQSWYYIIGEKSLWNGSYKFEVSMLDSYGDEIIPAKSSRFIVSIPPSIKINYPTSWATITSSSATFSWSWYSDAIAEYHYQITWGPIYTTTGNSFKANLTNWSYTLNVKLYSSSWDSYIAQDSVNFTVDIPVKSSGWWWSSSKTHYTNNLKLSLWNDSPAANEWIKLIVKIDDTYVWKVTFPKLQHYSSDTEKREDIPVTSKNYVSDYSDDAKLWYIKFSSSDDWRKDLNQFIKFSKNWYYRIYAEDKDWYDTYIEFKVSNKTTQTSNVTENKDTPTNNNINTIIQKYIPDISKPIDTTEEVYIARSCKKYTIQYSDSLNVYTSPNLNLSEYFISKEYFKRYVDSKNKYQSGCPTNVWWISTNYSDRTNDDSRYTAPNGKVYFITWRDWNYYSNELNKELKTPTSFRTIQELKYYIRDRNPLINMATLWPVN